MAIFAKQRNKGNINNTLNSHSNPSKPFGISLAINMPETLTLAKLHHSFPPPGALQ
jgi:hypothetical protein